MSKNSGSMYPPGFSRDSGVGKSLDLSALPPLLRMILVADGTITKLLEAFFWEPIDVRVTSQDIVQESPFDPKGEPEEVVHREVLLTSPARHCVLACARSVIVSRLLEEDLRASLMNQDIGIGALLRQRRVETYREQVAVYTRAAEETAALLEVDPDAKIAERTYRIFRRGEPFIQICEMFPIDLYVT